jgi:hypothetical protein
MLAAALAVVTLVPPVPGDIARAFTYERAAPFAAGRHRGADLAAPPGTPVGAACGGVVAWAGNAVVTVRCGAWRVTHLPLATIVVRPGARVSAGARIGTLGRDERHTGLHLGVRRAGDRFAYVDPAPLLAAARRPPVPVAPAPRRPPRGLPRTAPRAPRSAPRTVPRAAPRIAPRAAPRAAPRVAPPTAPRLAAPRRHPPRVAAPPRVRVSPPGLAPWPAWLGLGLLLLGAAGGGVRLRVRRRRAALAAVAREGVA